MKPIAISDTPKVVLDAFAASIGATATEVVEHVVYGKSFYYVTSEDPTTSHSRTLILDEHGAIHREHPRERGFVFDPTMKDHDALGHIIVECSGKTWAEGAWHPCQEKMQDIPSAVHAAGWHLARGKWKCGKCRAKNGR